MKILSLMLMISFLGIGSAFAESCKKESRVNSTIGGTLFYTTFLSFHKNLDFNYTSAFKWVDAEVEESLSLSCDRSLSKAVRWQKAHQVCRKACDAIVVDFHENILKTKFFKARKIKKHQRECKAVCGYVYSLQKQGKTKISDLNGLEFKAFLRKNR